MHPKSPPINIFISDLQCAIEKGKNEPAEISPNEKLGCLIWADDLLFLSESEFGLNNMLERYILKWKWVEG